MRGTDDTNKMCLSNSMITAECWYTPVLAESPWWDHRVQAASIYAGTDCSIGHGLGSQEIGASPCEQSPGSSQVASSTYMVLLSFKKKPIYDPTSSYVSTVCCFIIFASDCFWTIRLQLHTCITIELSWWFGQLLIATYRYTMHIRDSHFTCTEKLRFGKKTCTKKQSLASNNKERKSLASSYRKKTCTEKQRLQISEDIW